METTAFVFGIIGTTFAIIAWERIAALKKEFEKLKRSLEDSGVIKTESLSDDK